MKRETRKTDAKELNIRRTCILWGILGCVGMAAMLYTASTKAIVIADAAQEQTGLTGESRSAYHPEGSELSLRRDAGVEDSIYIPLEKGTRAEHVVIENRYMERELWIHLQDAEADFYADREIYGDTVPVRAGYCEESREGVILKLQMSGVLEYRSTMEDDILEVHCYEPGELYGMVVVVDPTGGGSDAGITVGGYQEKDIALQVAKLLQAGWEQEDVRLYFTRLEDEEVSRENRLELVDAVDADLYVGIGVSADEENPELYGISSFYNEEYFIPDFGNVQFADILTRKVTIASGNRAVGLIPASQDSILLRISVPAAQVSLGYLSNPQESALMEQETYREKLAQGLADAILEVYTGE